MPSERKYSLEYVNVQYGSISGKTADQESVRIDVVLQGRQQVMCV